MNTMTTVRGALKLAAGAVCVAALGLGLACGKGGEAAGSGGADKAAAAGSGAPSAKAVAEAKEIFADRCVTCHGVTGKGDGDGSKGLVPQPRDLSDPAWQKSVTDEHIEKIIMGGGAAVGKAMTMPSNPDLMSKSDVVKALRMHVRSLGGK